MIGCAALPTRHTRIPCPAEGGVCTLSLAGLHFPRLPRVNSLGNAHTRGSQPPLDTGFETSPGGAHTKCWETYLPAPCLGSPSGEPSARPVRQLRQRAAPERMSRKGVNSHHGSGENVLGTTPSFSVPLNVLGATPSFSGWEKQ